MRLVADIETNGFLDNVTVIHCIAAKDIDTGTVYTFHGSTIEEGVRFLQSADTLIFHNGISYDIPVLEAGQSAVMMCQLYAKMGLKQSRITYMRSPQR